MFINVLELVLKDTDYIPVMCLTYLKTRYYQDVLILPCHQTKSLILKCSDAMRRRKIIKVYVCNKEPLTIRPVHYQ